MIPPKQLFLVLVNVKMLFFLTGYAVNSKFSKKLSNTCYRQATEGRFDIECVKEIKFRDFSTGTSFTKLS